ncbi:hypothetical protein [Chondromyces crocatus]|uniref:Secreted protein n=1 Tax=Chondromyces crocatus TaxID=52 RepID=A0A0K1ERB8_CHOCO|nr:hypothetical protein [Chondromyces crocatus]AKT43192.1 uncharacterized protein CMC5_074230 [Chondromyces crocatus]
MLDRAALLPRRRVVLLGVLGVTLASMTACAPAHGTRTPLDEEFSALLPPGALASADAGEPLSVEDQRRGLQRLEAFRKEADGLGARTLRVSFALREPRFGRLLEARGAVAIAPRLDPGIPGEPPGALRMILLGPGGTTALDLWARGRRSRFAVPALDLLHRSDGAPSSSTPSSSPRGLPVDFLRWWLLRPASGELRGYQHADGTNVFVLQDGDARIELATRTPGPIAARRRTWTDARREQLRDEEVVIADRLGCGTIRYAQSSTGLLVTVRCEAEERTPPSQRAFDDPDAPASSPAEETSPPAASDAP